MFRSKLLGAAAIAGLSFALASPAAAVVWTEAPPGAGESLATAQDTSSTYEDRVLTEIVGNLSTIRLVDENPRTEVDLFRIYISDVATFSARTVSGNNDDTMLFLFDSAGHGIYANDDSLDLLSYLPPGGPLTAGFYFLGVSLGGYMALDSLGASLFASGSFTDVVTGDASSGPLASFMPTFQNLYEGGLPYDILLTGTQVAAVPEPETVLLMVVGLAALIGRSARRRSSAQHARVAIAA